MNGSEVKYKDRVDVVKRGEIQGCHYLQVDHIQTGWIGRSTVWTNAV